MVSEVPRKEEQIDLRSVRRIEHTLEAGESLSFPLDLGKNEWIEVVATQLGLDVAVDLLGTDGEVLLSVDSPIGREGEETLIAVVEVPGTYRLAVRAVEVPAPPGRFILDVVEIRSASKSDRQAAAAAEIFSKADEERRRWSSNSSRRAIQLYSEAFEAFRALGATRRAADSKHRMGWIYANLGDKQGASVLYEEALQLYRAIGDRRLQAMALGFLSASLASQRELDAAKQRVEEALEILEQPGSERLEAPSLLAVCLGNLARIHKLRGETAEALDVYRRALQLAEARGDRPQKATLEGNLGTLLLSQGLLDSAEDRLRQAADEWRALGNQRNEGAYWNRLGDVAKRRANEVSEGTQRDLDLSEALDRYQRARDLKRSAGDKRGEAIATDSIATVRSLQRDYVRARSRFEEAKRIYDELELRADSARVLVNLGRVHDLQNELEDALRVQLEAEMAVANTKDPQLIASNLYGIARALYRLKRLDEAAVRAEQLIRSVEEQRDSSSRESLKVAFFASKQQYYELAIDIQMSLSTKDAAAQGRAFSLSERRRARMLLDLLGEERAQIRERAAPVLLRRENRLQEELNRKATSRPTDDSIRRIRSDLDQVRAEIRDTAPDDLFHRTVPVELEEARSLVTSPQTQLLSYTIGEDRSHLWLVSPDEIHAFELPARRVIEKAAMDAYQALQSVNEDKAEQNRRTLRWLSRLVLGPAAPKLDKHRLVIVAEGALLNFPFAALPKPEQDPSSDGGSDWRELVRSHEIVHLPSVSVLRSIRNRRAGRGVAPELLLLIADPRFSPPSDETTGSLAGSLQRSLRSFGWEDVPPLPGTGREADAILDVAEGSIRSFRGEEATKANLLATDLSRYQILHVATHALVHRDHPELSSLILALYDSAGQEIDGHLRLHEIYNLDLGTELVVLSACRTAMGQRVRGEGMLGLSRAFFYAGSPRLVASHWNVSDSETMELMRRFYWAMLELGLPPAAALRAAQISMLSSSDAMLAHPVAWAGFSFQGDWDVSEPRFDEPIEGAAGANPPDEETDVDYPVPDMDLCQSLTEVWKQEVCQAARELGPDRLDLV